jgi:hypothetical protein
VSSLDYIVRIFRFGKDKPRNILGAKEVGIDGKRVFSDLDELWRIFTTGGDPDTSKRFPKKKVKGPAAG